MGSSRETVTLSWPAPSLPGICARTGVATRSGVVLSPRGASYEGAELILPFSTAVTLRQRALRRLAALAVLAAAGFGAAAAFSWFLIVPALVTFALGLYAWHSARTLDVFPIIEGRALILPQVHPAFAAAVAAMPERCGKTEDGACETCTSSCLPQVQSA